MNKFYLPIIITSLLLTSCSPKNDITVNVIKDENIIYDENKDKAVFYDTKDIRILEDIKLDFKNSEDEYEKMWKTFIKAVTIKERKNLRCQRNFMPKKYWKNLLEVNVWIM